MAISAPPGEVHDAVFNPVGLLKEIGGDRRLFHALVKTAQHELPRHLDLLEKAGRKGEYAKVQSVSHAVKTILAHWHAGTAHGIAEAIEELCRTDRASKAVTRIPELVGAVRKVLEALEQVEDRI